MRNEDMNPEVRAVVDSIREQRQRDLDLLSETGASPHALDGERTFYLRGAIVDKALAALRAAPAVTVEDVARAIGSADKDLRGRMPSRERLLRMARAAMRAMGVAERGQG